MISICFAGVTGWTAPPILAAIDAADDLTLTSGVSRSAAGSGAVYATVAQALAPQLDVERERSAGALQLTAA